MQQQEWHQPPKVSVNSLNSKWVSLKKNSEFTFMVETYVAAQIVRF